MRFVLIGQPNCGKSTLFNQVAGYRAETGNFPGTTVTFTETKVRVLGEVIELVDLPGTYTLLGTNPAERVVLDYLTSKDVDAIINIVDATHMAQGLALTLELLELERPIVVAVNMMDEAKLQGLKINGPQLQQLLGAPVLSMIATRGQGVHDVFASALEQSRNKTTITHPPYSKPLEQSIVSLVNYLKDIKTSIGTRALAVKLLEGDPVLLQFAKSHKRGFVKIINTSIKNLCKGKGKQAMWLIATERHDLAKQLTKKVIVQSKQGLLFRDRIDDVLLHPIWGYLVLLIILGLFFIFVYKFGNWLEGPLLDLFGNFELNMFAWLGEKGLLSQVISGAIQGISGGIAIVLPYLVPFLVGLGFLEDIGYLTRIAFLMDALMHRLGLHGKAIVPFILSYGCNVPAIMSTRIMEDPRDRYLSSALATMVPCAARLSVIFGLAAFYLGPFVGVGIYLFNLFVIALVGRLLTFFFPEISPGLILEMPVYRLPTMRTVTAKAWYRIREFVFEAWPLLVLGSILLSLLNYFNITVYMDALTRPITWLLGLPSKVGTPLIFGIFRKELSLIMLGQALGSMDFVNILTPMQIVSYTIFIVFYVPCLATLVTIRNELGTKAMFAITALTTIVALIAALFSRLLFFLIL
ncbi:MAG TPA: ferrous iron transport protein B [Anaerolineae bacterium]|nr:ferrous iron transport protein B [Anaerolineae bacterium]